MKPRHILLILAAAALLVGLGTLSGKLFPRSAVENHEPAATPLDSATRAAWEKTAAWLFREDSLSAFRESLLLPFIAAHGVESRGLRRRGGFIEATFPRGRPLYSIANDLETRAGRVGFVVVEGREAGERGGAVEYLLRDAGGRTYTLRLIMGQTETPGFFRIALVITDVGRASAADLQAWLDFPLPVTLVFPDTVAAPDDGEPTDKRDIFIELPMEPAAYPVVKPGPRALFIHHTRGETERILRQRLDRNPDATGFATRLGDRAIEHPDLMDYVLAFTADRSLLFLDLTGSPRSQAPQAALRTGGQIFSAVAQEPGSPAVLKAELVRRTAAAKRSGEGVWVLRHTHGLPATLAALLRTRELEGDAAPRWVSMRQLHRNGE